MEVALIGKSPGRELAPEHGGSVTTWGVNDIVRHRQVGVCFWMDRRILADTNQDRVVTASVNKTNTPMYSVQKWEDIPTSIAYPIDNVTKFFGVDYFADSCCYMLALAIYQGFSHIKMYGWTYAWGSVYVVQRPCVEYWLGVAMGRGVKVSIFGEHSALFQTHRKDRYSFEERQTMGRENLEVSDGIIPEGKTKLSVTDRVQLLGILPKSGSYKAMKFIDALRLGLLFDIEDQKKLAFRYVDEKDKPGKPMLMWNTDHNVADKAYKMTAAQNALVATWVRELDTQGKINRYNMGLYKKFCLGNKP